MEIQFERMLLQVLMMLFPFVLYLVLVNEKISNKRSKVIFGITCVITTVLSLTFAVHIEERILDLRLIPIYLAFMYGGNITGIIIAIFYIILRLFVGGSGMPPAVFAVPITGIILYGKQKLFFSWKLKRKLITSTIFLSAALILHYSIGVFILGVKVTSDYLIMFSLFILANAIVTWLLIYLIESQLEKMTLHKEIQNAEKFNVIGQLAASVAHEIRNPMTSIRGFMQILQSSNRITSSEKEYVKICIEEVDRANSIIADYLALGKNQPNGKSKLDIVREIKTALRSLSSFATLNNVQLNFPHKLPIYLVGNGSRIQQLFINLIKNGIEASCGKGTIDIEISTDDKNVYISISDDGEGMSKETADNFGLPFYSTKEKGTGLGLMVSRQIIDEMGGSIKVNSTKGIGTVLYLTFPRAKKSKEE
ncbi:sporulation kinase [Heyndrickxia sporothermodurans]|nr:sporulation kinase [Heyndrickxia sporothermodurans]